MTAFHATCFGVSILVAWPAPAPAAPDSGGTQGHTAPAPEAPAVRWRDEWPRFRPWEYVATAAALGTGFYLRFGLATKDPNWRGGILFDDAVLDAVALDSVEANELGQRLGDVFFNGILAYRLVDSVAVPLIGYGDADLALQMSMIDLEAFGTVALVLWSAQAVVRRERPVITRRCDEPEFAENHTKCGGDSTERGRSFIAGHFAIVLTGAGLTCLHHGNIPLYGGAGDDIACGATIGAAGMTAGLRLMTEDHYPTDVLLGVGLGLFGGWVVPSVLHYDAEPPERVEGRRRAPAITLQILPMLGEDRAGVAAAGTF